MGKAFPRDVGYRLQKWALEKSSGIRPAGARVLLDELYCLRRHLVLCTGSRQLEKANLHASCIPHASSPNHFDQTLIGISPGWGGCRHAENTCVSCRRSLTLRVLRHVHVESSVKRDEKNRSTTSRPRRSK